MRPAQDVATDIESTSASIGHNEAISTRQYIMGETAENTCMHAGLAFSDEVYSGLAFISVGDQTSTDRGSTHAALLSTFPSVRMAEHEANVPLDCLPEVCAVCMSVLNELARATKEIREEVSEDVLRGLAWGQRAQTHAVHVEVHAPWTEPQLEELDLVPLIFLSLGWNLAILCLCTGSDDSAMAVIV